MTLPRLSDLQVFSWMRVLCGIFVLINQIFIQRPHFLSFYSGEGMINPNLFDFFPSSPLFYIWTFEGIKWALFSINIVLAVFFTFGVFARLVHGPLFFFCLCFQMANPLVVHEPQQIGQLLLLILWLVPYENYLTIKKTPGFLSYESLSEKAGSKIVWLLQAFIGYYYFMAGFKKLPDPLWISGKAFEVLLRSPYLGLDNPVSRLFLFPPVSALANWGGLLFELSFVFIVFTRYRHWLFIMGIFFHGANMLLFDVGLFWMAMWMWYPILLFKRGTRNLLGP